MYHIFGIPPPLRPNRSYPTFKMLLSTISDPTALWRETFFLTNVHHHHDHDPLDVTTHLQNLTGKTPRWIGTDDREKGTLGSLKMEPNLISPSLIRPQRTKAGGFSFPSDISSISWGNTSFMNYDCFHRKLTPEYRNLFFFLHFFLYRRLGFF